MSDIGQGYLCSILVLDYAVFTPYTPKDLVHCFLASIVISSITIVYHISHKNLHNGSNLC